MKKEGIYKGTWRGKTGSIYDVWECPFCTHETHESMENGGESIAGCVHWRGKGQFEGQEDNRIRPICVCGGETDPTGTVLENGACVHYCKNCGAYMTSGCYGELCRDYNCPDHPYYQEYQQEGEEDEGQD